MLCKFRQKQLFSIRLFHLHCGNYMIKGVIYVILSYVYLFIIMFTTISALQWMSRCYCAQGVPCMIQEILLHSKYCIWFHSHLPCELVLFFYKSKELSYCSLLFVRLSRLWLTQLTHKTLSLLQANVGNPLWLLRILCLIIYVFLSFCVFKPSI
jgi:hypothetical protein